MKNSFTESTKSNINNSSFSTKGLPPLPRARIPRPHTEYTQNHKSLSTLLGAPDITAFLQERFAMKRGTSVK